MEDDRRYGTEWTSEGKQKHMEYGRRSDLRKKCQHMSVCVKWMYHIHQAGWHRRRNVSCPSNKGQDFCLFTGGIHMLLTRRWRSSTEMNTIIRKFKERKKKINTLRKTRSKKKSR